MNLYNYLYNNIKSIVSENNNYSVVNSDNFNRFNITVT